LGKKLNFMKKLLTFSAIALFGMALISGCSKSSSSSPSYSMTASVSGTSYSAGNCIAVNNGTYIVIEGIGGATTAPTFPYLAISLTNYNKTTGTFNFDSSQTTNWAEYLTSSSTYKISKSGSVTITSVSPNITGTFLFTCTDGTVVSSGSFTAKSY
jgi:hypothetical protein